MEKTVNKLLILTLVGTLVFGALTYLFRNAPHDSVCRDERSFPLCEYINIELQRLPVTLIPCDEENIRAAYKNDTPLSFEIGDNSLSITESDRFVISLFTGKDSDFGLYLYLPRHSFRDVTVYTSSGNVKIGRVDSEKLTVITDSGDISCEHMVALGDLITTDGSISVDFEFIVPNTEIFSRNGDAVITLPQNASVAVDFETETGQCVTELWNGPLSGSYMYSFNGGDKLIRATLEKGTLTIK